MKCSNYKTVTSGNTYWKTVGIACAADGVVYIYDSTMEAYTKDQFKTAMSGVQLVYPLASPQTVQLTAQQVQTLIYNNNVFADTGNVSLTYTSGGEVTRILV